MSGDRHMRIDRLAGSDAISAKAIAIGTELDVVISRCVWDLGADLGHEYAHRLDLGTATDTVRLYFSDLDLTTPDSESRSERTADRLRRAIAQLIARTPSSTYPFQ